MTKPGFSACQRSLRPGLPLWQGGHYSFWLVDGHLGYMAADGAARGHVKLAEKPG